MHKITVTDSLGYFYPRRKAVYNYLVNSVRPVIEAEAVCLASDSYALSSQRWGEVLI